MYLQAHCLAHSLKATAWELHSHVCLQGTEESELRSEGGRDKGAETFVFTFQGESLLLILYQREDINWFRQFLSKILMHIPLSLETK
jgi:hypothetical protein